jgi:hypothetical protein
MAVDGTYETEISTPMGALKSKLTIKTEGDKASGTMESTMMGTQEFSGGTVSGDEVSWTMEANSPMGSLTLEPKLKVSGDDISGEIQAGNFGSFPLTGKRV